MARPNFHYHFPLDPECPEVIRERMALEDPMTIHYGIGDELWEDFERHHLPECKRCQEYGVANCEVEA